MRSPHVSSASLFHAEVVASARREEQELAAARAQREACATECAQQREKLRWLEEELAVRTVAVAAHEERCVAALETAAENVLQARNAIENVHQAQSSEQGQEQGQEPGKDLPQSDQTNFFHQCLTFPLQAASCQQRQEQASVTRRISQASNSSVPEDLPQSPRSVPEDLPQSAETNTFVRKLSL